MNITTDNKWKDFRYSHEMPKKILAKEFDWLDEAEVDGFFKYRGWWYHIDEFTRLEKGSPFPGWHCYKSDSFFSGVVIKLSDDGQQYQVGTYIE